MKDIPMFTTENGIASLTLKEVPYTAKAYVTVHSSSEPDLFIWECADLCRAAGADTVYARGHDSLERFPYHTAVITMSRETAQLPKTDATLLPVQLETLEQWREIYNEAMKEVPVASYMSKADTQKLLEQGNGYFVYRGETLLGIGAAGGGKVDALAAVLPGAGQDVLLALCSTLSESAIRVEVATENQRAVRLYERLGFIPTVEIARWYQIF